MCDHFLIGKHIVAYAPLIFIVFLYWRKICVIYEKISDSIVYCYWKEILWNKLCHHCQRGKQIWRKILCKSLWSLSDRKHILPCSLLSFFVSLFKENPVRYNLYLFVYVISYCKINLWGDMCDHSLIGKHILPHSLLLIIKREDKTKNHSSICFCHMGQRWINLWTDIR